MNRLTPLPLAALLLSHLTYAQSLSTAPTPTTIPPSPLPGLTYNADFFPGSAHNPNIPTPDSILGFRLGDKPVMHSQIEAVIKQLAAKSPRCRLFEHGKSHEGKTLYHLIISSEDNIKNLDNIRDNAAKLADPRKAPIADIDSLITTSPAIAWMAYAIHGDEMSGADASLALAWHLASCTDASITSLLREVVVIIDPLMNPDGRDRSINAIHENRTNAPSIDDQSILHSQAWPSGRMNHYLFDLNRDWIFGTQPETRGRIAAVNRWNPHYFMESHEMGSQDTFLFMPPRDPMNPNYSRHVLNFERTFALDQGKAFDAHGWRYYNGEWNEGWYPGYSGSWAAMRGIIDNLYEQANIHTDAVRRAEGTLESYREAVHKQLVSSLANISTLAKHRRDVLAGYVSDRRENLAPDGPYNRRSFLIPIDAVNLWRIEDLLSLLHLQGIESATLKDNDLTFSGRDWLGRPFTDRTWPAKDRAFLFIPARQPLARLVSTLFELDPRMPDSFLTDERRELLRLGQSKLYDITGWNLALLTGLEIFEVDAPLPAGADLRIQDPGTHRSLASAAMRSALPANTTAVAFFADGNDDRSVALAARLMERGIWVRILDKPTQYDNQPLPRGSVVITRKDNQDYIGDLTKTLADAAAELGILIKPIASGMGPGDNPDLGGQHLVLLHPPRIAVLTRDPLNPYTAGEIWHLIDQELGIRASYLNTEIASSADLRRYNVLVIPDGDPALSTKMLGSLKPWVEAGGTLIAIGSSCAAFAKEKDGLGSTRLIHDVLTKRDDYRTSIIRDHLGKTSIADPAATWSQTAPAKIEYPWAIDSDSLSEEELKRRDAWRAIFMPQGALLAARTDDRSYLTAGSRPILPVIYGSGQVLIPSTAMHAPLLLGAIVPSTPASSTGILPVSTSSTSAPSQTTPSTSTSSDTNKKSDNKDGEKDDKKENDKNDKKSEPKPGWTTAPPGHELRLRMSGLLWPEAADRLAHSAYMTREPIGSGQLILFSNSPTFRAATPATKRLFANAIIYGPGMGANQPIKP
ncbi:MAG: hypothetical protein IT435_18525 [Phycisphaerales bacterium]|nr:hypothetical protein [Phycisphaerales bacterium]